MEKLRPKKTACHDSKSILLPGTLNTATHVFVRNDTVRIEFTLPYNGPHKVLNRSLKNLEIQIGSKEVNVSIDRLKPAFAA